MNPYIPKKAKILDIRKQTVDTNLYKINYKIKHEPGQFVQIGLLGIGECPISICSDSEKYIDLCIRNVGNVTKFIYGLKKGDNVFVRGPYGNGYPMQMFKHKDILVVGGGTGVAPLRSVIEYIENKRKSFGDVYIFLGFRSPDDILFKEDIKRWSKKFHLVLTVDKAPKTWKGNIGYLMPLLEKEKFNIQHSVVLTCGPPIMIKFVLQSLKKMDFSDDQIYVSYERLMHCGIGKCGHCAISGYLVCKHGPVFNYSVAKNFED